jgi:predicted GNAT family acetyltransferase
MVWTLTSDVTQYLAAAGDLLRSRAVENTIVLTASESLRARGADAFGDTPPLFGHWADAAGDVTAAFMHTPPFGVVLTAMTDEVATELANELAGRDRIIVGVNGYDDTCQVFARAWQDRTGQAYRIQRHSRLHWLNRLRPPDPAPPGRARVATGADRDLLVVWMEAFHDEADPGPAREMARAVDDRLGYGGLTLWGADGVPVSMAGRNRAVAGQVRIGPVYTPPELRGRGFGGAVTAAVSQAALDSGVADVILFTDLANPTSNALYKRLGFEPVSDRLELAFEMISS